MSINIRHSLGLASEYGHMGPALFEVCSEELLDRGTLVDKMYEAVKAVGLKRPVEQEGSPTPWKMLVTQVHVFRGVEVELPYLDGQENFLDNVATGLAGVKPRDVVLVTYRHDHSNGKSYDYRILAVPNGSELPEESQWYCEDQFDKDINWMSGVDSNAECSVSLPEHAKIWDGSQWVAISELQYDY